MLARIAALVTDQPRRVLLATGILLALAVGFGAPVAGLLSVHPDEDFVDSSSQNSITTKRLEAARGSTLSPGVVVLVHADAPLRSARGRAQLRRVVDVVRHDRAVARLSSALSSGPHRSPFVSRDGRSSFVAVYLRTSSGRDDATRIERAVKRPAPATGARGSVAFPHVRVGGLAIAAPQIGDQVSTDLGRAELLAFPLLFALSLVIFRGAVAALLPLLVGLLTIMATFLGLRIVNELTPLSIFALNLAIGLGLGLAIDYSLFILSRYREEMERVGPGRGALARTLSTAGRTVVFSSLTVAAAMLALLVFPQRFLYSMAISGSLTALSAAAIALTALSATIMVLGERVNALAPRRWRHREAATESGFWYRLSRLVMRRPVIVAVLTGALLVTAGVPFARIQFTGVDASVLPRSAEPRQVDVALRSQFPPGRTSALHVAVDAPRSAARRLRAYAARLRARGDVEAVDPPQYVAAGTWQLEVVPGAPALNPRSLDLVRAVRAGPAPGTVAVAGESARFVDQRAGLAERLPLAIAVLAITTLVILFALTGSVVLPLKAIAMNVLGISAAFGVLVFVFQDGRLEGLLSYTSHGALEITQPLVLLAIAFGLSTDYGVFLLTRIKEAHDAGASNEDAVALGLQRTGRIITAAALLLVVALGAFATSQLAFVKQLGVGTAVAVAVDATVVRALLVPALMKLLGERNWWAPRPLRGLHQRLGLADGHPAEARAQRSAKRTAGPARRCPAARRRRS